MKILIFYEQFSWGGVDKHLEELLNDFIKKKIQIILITNRNNQGFNILKKKIKHKNIKFINFNSYSYSYIHDFLIKKKLEFILYFIAPFQPLILLFTIIRFFKLLKKFKNVKNIFSINGAYPASWANISIIYAAKLLNFKKRVMLVHHEASKPRLVLKLYNWLIDKLLSRCLTDLVCVSKATLSSIKKKRNLNFRLFKSKIIYNDLKIFQKNLSKKLFFNYKKKNFLFGILGRADNYKGHEDVLFAINKMDKFYKKKFKLLIIGENRSKVINNLKNISLNLKISENIIFTGYIKEPSQTIVYNLDAVIMATRDFEGFGYTALEAIKLGKPLITTNVGAIKEFVNPKYVEIINPKNPNQIYFSMKKILNDPNFFKKRAMNYKKLKNDKFLMGENFKKLFI